MSAPRMRIELAKRRRLNRFHVSFLGSIREEPSIWDSLRTPGMVMVPSVPDGPTKERPPTRVADMIIVQNWIEELKQKVRAK
jgi:hypothetical protein